ncbi:MAG: hypothetical protein JXX28_05575 [Deltaproteobacteria bacterium]|nr:hypothetical protein [Deltaproteobacteria bacterium]
MIPLLIALLACEAEPVQAPEASPPVLNPPAASAVSLALPDSALRAWPTPRGERGWAVAIEQEGAGAPLAIQEIREFGAIRGQRLGRDDAQPLLWPPTGVPGQEGPSLVELTLSAGSAGPAVAVLLAQIPVRGTPRLTLHQVPSLALGEHTAALRPTLRPEEGWDLLLRLPLAVGTLALCDGSALSEEGWPEIRLNPSPLRAGDAVSWDLTAAGQPLLRATAAVPLDGRPPTLDLQPLPRCP